MWNEILVLIVSLTVAAQDICANPGRHFGRLGKRFLLSSILYLYVAYVTHVATCFAFELVVKNFDLSKAFDDVDYDLLLRKLYERKVSQVDLCC